MKKKSVLIITALVVVCVAGYIVSTIPFYPAFEKDVGSYKEVYTTLEKKDIFMPAKEHLPFTPKGYQVKLDGRTLLAKVEGGHVSGTEEYQGTTIYHDILIQPATQDDKVQLQGDVTLTHESGNIRATMVRFLYRDHTYRLYAYYVGDTMVEVDAYLEEKLMDSADQIMRQVGLVEYPVLPAELTDHWVIEEADGTATSQATIPCGDKWYKLTEDEYRQLMAGADPDEVLAARWEWYTPIASDPEPENIGLTEEDAAVAFAFAVDGQSLSLGVREGDFPWEYEGLPAIPGSDENTDMGETGHSFYHGGVTVAYFTYKDGQTQKSNLHRMITSEPGPATPRGITVGDTAERMAEVYPEAVYCSFYEYGTGETIPYYDSVYIYEPGGHGFCKHIGFYITDGIITTIEIVDMIDGRILN